MSIDLNAAAAAARRLPPRQRQALVLLAGGKLRKEIAAELRISVSTANNYCAIVFERLKVQNAREATRVAVTAGLV